VVDGNIDVREMRNRAVGNINGGIQTYGEIMLVCWPSSFHKPERLTIEAGLE
jgi:hypothetical protein